MSSFLGNIINRHQSAGVDLAANNIVQPRPKSRFENFVDYGETFAENHQDLNTSTETTYKQPEAKTQTTQTNKIINPVQNKNELINTSSSKKQQHPVKITPEIEKNITPNMLTTKAKYLLSEPPLDNSLSNTNTTLSKNTLTPSEETPFSSEQGFEIPENEQFNARENNKKQHFQNRIDALKTPQINLLQNSQWLTEIQANINHHQQEFITQEKAEPVINVTIGRIEIKAVQPPTKKQRKNQQKPKGIMSLDDYVKQRNVERL